MPPVDNSVPPIEVGALGKILAGFGVFPMFSARTVDHDAPRPEVTVAADAEYGSFLIRSCVGCHGDELSGGAIPGAPSNLPVPANLTPHETGTAGWSFEDFETAARTGVRPDGRTLDDFMPNYSGLEEVELRAIWAYLQSLEPREFGGR